jgi:antitoxin (DNA-binding transcriptional repressor) of toxin-antitoxin stability system
MTVTRAGNALGRIVAAHPRPFIPIPPQGGVEFGFEKLFNEAANARAHPSFQRVEPIIAEKMFTLGRADRRLCAIHCHGVISIGALTPILVVFTSWRLRHPQIPTTSATAPNPPVSIDKIVKLVQSKDALFPRERIREIAREMGVEGRRGRPRKNSAE